MADDGRIARFYDEMAGDYHLIFKDWEAAQAQQAGVISGLLRARLGDGPLTLLDCACGIGTQALGMAALPGWQVTATDLSANSVARAQAEAERQGLAIDFAAVDMRDLVTEVDGTFDAVIAFDNALPHLLTADDMAQAAAGFYARTRPGGLFAASVRDYEAVLDEKPTLTSQRVRPDANGGLRVSFQVWEWDDEHYTLTQFIHTGSGETWETRHFTARYWAVRRGVISDALTGAGFGEVVWLGPEESGYYQPVVLAVR